MLEAAVLFSVVAALDDAVLTDVVLADVAVVDEVLAVVLDAIAVVDVVVTDVVYAVVSALLDMPLPATDSSFSPQPENSPITKTAIIANVILLFILLPHLINGIEQTLTM